MEYFKRELSEYTTGMNPIRNYMTQAVALVQIARTVDKSTATRIVKNLIKESQPKDPIVTYLERQDNGDRTTETCRLSDYISETIRANDIIVPSLTVYDHPSKQKSLHADFLSINIAKRKFHKNKAFEEYQKGNIDGYTYHDVLQKVMKIFNNSLSGAYASKSTVLYNPSQHYTLTSITRSVASIGNAVTESVVAGNKCLYTPDSVINYITSVISTVDLNKISSAMMLYKLIYPTADEVMVMLTYSSDRYWSDDAKSVVIRDYIGNLDKYQLAAVMYVNDLYHMRKLNDNVVKEFVGSMATRMPTGESDPFKVLNRDVEGINNLVHHICMDDIRGMKVDYNKLKDTNPELLTILGSTAANVYRVLDKYKLLLSAFFTTDILPIDIANIKECYRDVIVLSDTDSTCGSYDNWTTWYFEHERFTTEAVALSAVVMTINTQVIDHNIRVFAKNMNIADDLVSLLKMKNEYFWSVFITANVSKHYYANTWIQEGNVYAKAKLELKGVHLLASAGNQAIVKDAQADMVNLLTTIEKGEKIDPVVMLTKVANLERKLLAAIDAGDIDIFKLDKIKNHDAYKDPDRTKTPYFHHMLWMDVFADKYGTPGEPTYMTIKVPTVIKSKRTLAEYLATIEDLEIRDKLSKMLSKHGKTALGTYRIPLAIAGGSGVPKEIIQAVDRKRMVLDNMNIYYIKLESMGLYRTPNLLFSEMGY